VTNPVCLSENL